MKIRRIIAGTDGDGIARVFSDGAPSRNVVFSSLPGLSSTLVWSTNVVPTVGREVPSDETPQIGYLPTAGETRLLVMTLPPDSVMLRAEFDGIAFGGELAQKLPDFAPTFEPANPGMHTTDTIDYDIVLQGHVVLELDNGEQVPLQQNEIVIQHGNRHAWRNVGNEPAVLLVVLIGAVRK